MFFHSYLRNGIVYLPTLGMVEDGLYRAMEPVAVASVSDANELRHALQETVKRENPLVPRLLRADYPKPVLPKYAGVKSWSAFARSARLWNFKQKGEGWQITGYRPRHDRGLEEDPNQIVRFPPGTDIEAVIDRMIEILQAAAERERAPRAAPKR